MKDLKHTKGEWYSCCTSSKPHFTFAGEEKVVCSIIQKQEMCEDLPLEEVQANAKLISAAPDLLEALQELIDLNNNEEKQGIKSWHNAFGKAEEAIKKVSRCFDADLTSRLTLGHQKVIGFLADSCRTSKQTTSASHGRSLARWR